MEEVRKHNTKGDLWAVWQGKVLDLSKFVEDHPGGIDVILEEAGRDMSISYENIGHSDAAQKLALEHTIGLLVRPYPQRIQHNPFLGKTCIIFTLLSEEERSQFVEALVDPHRFKSFLSDSGWWVSS